MSVFYDHLTDIHTLEEQLTPLLPDPAERQQVIDIFDTTLHHAVLGIIFEQVPVSVHELFLVRFHADPIAPSHLSFLRQYSPEIDHHIRTVAAEHRQQFIDTIHA